VKIFVYERLLDCKCYEVAENNSERTTLASVRYTTVCSLLSFMPLTKVLWCLYPLVENYFMTDITERQT